MLRIDSIEFVVGAALLVAAMRALPRRAAAVCYAGLSLGVYLWLLPNLASLAWSLGFVFWPLALTRLRRPFHRALLPTCFTIQTGALLWSRKYLVVFPQLAEQGWLAHALPIVGVSYIILRQVELLSWVDADEEAEVGLVDYTAHMLGMFTLLAGPIIPWRQFQRGFLHTEPEDARTLARQLNRIVNGYLKVSLLSPWLYDLTNLQTLTTAEFSLSAKLAFFYLYPWYIYLNFSGYCDVVIGCAGLARFRMPENFDHPFAATSIQNYWQRWHITFSQWIRNHLFFPLVRAMRTAETPLWRALALPLAVFVTFVIVGLWHGTDPGFAVFGVLHGLGVLAVAPYGMLLKRLAGEAGVAAYERSRAARVLRTGLCYHYLCFTMIFFERPLAAIWPLLWGSP